MALNKYMHPRNIYKTPPDFGNLSKLFSEFSAISKVDVTGKITIDFKDPHSLRILTKCLLKSDFNLDVDIPEDRLVPTLPLRLNYILWIEDLLESIQRRDNIKGIDIGTGACAIYPLLAAVKNKWNFLATETDSESLSKAQENIQKNNLQEIIQLKKNTTQSIISHVFSDEPNQEFDFCMCNPPFYSTLQELYESRSPARLPPKNGFTGSPQELITEGGELEFCRQLIKESKMYKECVNIFTTMVGHKYNVSVLIQQLKLEGIKHTHTEFCQGRVTRWGLAWTFKDYDLIKLVPPRDKPRKKHTPTIYVLPELPNSDNKTDIALNKIKEILDKLDITNNLIDKRGKNVTLDIVAHTNTWSNQRRKRRLERRIETVAKITKPNEEKDEEHKTKLNSESVLGSDSPASTRDDESVCSQDKSFDSNVDDQLVDSVQVCKRQPLVHAFLKLVKKENNTLLELEYFDGNAGKEGLHQIAQYIKNNWK
nr:U6 small nuclear RNA (adenine-(43)-N(6))-methyltransferase [Helicoverpa armigera]